VSAVGTTDVAAAGIIVRSWLPTWAVRGNCGDSAVVIVTTSYKGAPVSGSPIRVVIPIKGNIPQ
jgi:hypothetical protein